MKAFNIVATAALFSATFSWAKKMEDNWRDGKDIDADKFNDAMAKKQEKMMDIIKYLESQA